MIEWATRLAAISLVVGAWFVAGCSSPGHADPAGSTVEARPADAGEARQERADEIEVAAAVEDRLGRDDRRRVDPQLELDRRDPGAGRAGSGSDGATGRSVVRVAGRAIGTADLADVFQYFFRDAYYEAIGYLIENEIVRAEAVRLGVMLTRDELEPAVDHELELQSGELAAQFGGEVSLEEFVADNFKLDLEAYRERVTDVVRSRLLRDRIIRYSLLREGSVDVRRIAVADRALAEEIERKIEAGADFDVLAKQHSLALSRGREGLLEEVRRGFLPPEVDQAVFSLEPRETTPILEVVEDGGTHYDLYRLIRREPAQRVSYGAVRDQIVTDLDARPVAPLEVLQWNRAVARRYPVEYDSP